MHLYLNIYIYDILEQFFDNYWRQSNESYQKSETQKLFLHFTSGPSLLFLEVHIFS